MSSKKIVVIDDEATVCNFLARLLKDAGYDVASSMEPMEGIELVKKERPDCVLLDIKMPQMGGIDALVKIKEFDRNIRVIMMTGYGSLETAMESMKRGATDYITKPFDPDFITGLVGRCLEKTVRRQRRSGEK